VVGVKARGKGQKHRYYMRIALGNPFEVLSKSAYNDFSRESDLE
jgi:hypothetical protein